MRCARTYHWIRMLRSVARSTDAEPLSLCQFCLGCIIAMRGFNFREGQDDRKHRMDDALILAYCANPAGSNFREPQVTRTSVVRLTWRPRHMTRGSRYNMARKSRVEMTISLSKNRPCAPHAPRSATIPTLA